MVQHKECDIEYEVGFKEFRTKNCFKINIQKRINEATENESSHTSYLSKEKS